MTSDAGATPPTDVLLCPDAAVTNLVSDFRSDTSVRCDRSRQGGQLNGGPLADECHCLGWVGHIEPGRRSTRKRGIGSTIECD
jgi:hypothetical protein